MKEQKGITLVALVITIIVMLILVVVTVTLANQNGGLFQTARNAANGTQNAANTEQELANGMINGKTLEQIANGEV